MNAETGDPIPLAAVSIHYAFDTTSTLGPLVATSRTDESGSFTASFLRPGRYEVLPEDLVRGTSGPTRTVEVKPAKRSRPGSSSTSGRISAFVRLPGAASPPPAAS